MQDNFHPLVAVWIAHEDEQKRTAKRNGWSAPLGLFSDTENGRRALRLHDAILKAGEARGYTAEKPKDNAGQFGFLVRGEHISWRVREGYSRRKVPLDKTERKDPFNISMGRDTKIVDAPTGNLVLYFTAHYSVDKRLEDKPGKPLDGRIDEILERFDVAATHAAEREAEHQAFMRQRQEELQRRQALERLRADEEKRWASLRQVAADRSEVERLRETVDLVRKRMADDNIDQPRVTAWLRWAEERIDDLDLLSKDATEIYGRLIGKSVAQEYDEDLEEDL